MGEPWLHASPVCISWRCSAVFAAGLGAGLGRAARAFAGRVQAAARLVAAVVRTSIRIVTGQGITFAAHARPVTGVVDRADESVIAARGGCFKLTGGGTTIARDDVSVIALFVNREMTVAAAGRSDGDYLISIEGKVRDVGEIALYRALLGLSGKTLGGVHHTGEFPAVAGTGKDGAA